MEKQNKELPKRKSNRLRNYDYSQNGAYFITICIKDKKNLLWNVGANNVRPNDAATLSEAGVITKTAIHNISIFHPSVSVDKYVIMPNHVHMILEITNEETGGRLVIAPTVSRVMQQMKGYVTKQIGIAIWQKSFHDHIIRNETDYLEIWEYVDSNPQKWQGDYYYNCKF